MYQCIYCGEIFRDPVQGQEVMTTDPFYMETFPACPYCGSGEIKEADDDEDEDE